MAPADARCPFHGPDVSEGSMARRLLPTAHTKESTHERLVEIDPGRGRDVGCVARCMQQRWRRQRADRDEPAGLQNDVRRVQMQHGVDLQSHAVRVLVDGARWNPVLCVVGLSVVRIL